MLISVLLEHKSIFQSTTESTDVEGKAPTEGKKAPKDAPPANIGWNSHEAVVSKQYFDTTVELPKVILKKLFLTDVRTMSLKVW